MATPQQAIAKWQRGMSTAAESIKAGVDGVTVNPAEQAAAAADKWFAKVSEAHAQGRFAKGLGKVSLAEWKQAMKDKGAQNAAQGAAKLSARAQRNMQEVLEYTQQVKAQIASMPNNTEGEADARMLKAVELMRAYKKNK